MDVGCRFSSWLQEVVTFLLCLYRKISKRIMKLISLSMDFILNLAISPCSMSNHGPLFFCVPLTCRKIMQIPFKSTWISTSFEVSTAVMIHTARSYGEHCGAITLFTGHSKMTYYNKATKESVGLKMIIFLIFKGFTSQREGNWRSFQKK
jgi:hypothetical protein